MPRRWSALALVAALAAVAVAGTASGAGTGDQLTSTWAKLNICNPTQLGARAQLAGDGSSDRMAVRFTAQWLGPDGWVPLSGKATLALAGRRLGRVHLAAGRLDLRSERPARTARPTSCAPWPR